MRFMLNSFSINQLPLEIEQSPTTSKLPLWLTESQYAKLSEKYGSEAVMAGIEDVEMRGEGVKRPRPYLSKGLREGWLQTRADDPQRSTNSRGESSKAIVGSGEAGPGADHKGVRQQAE